MKRLYFTTVPVKLKVGEKRLYRMVVQHNGQIGEETFKARVARRCGHDVSVVNGVMGGFQGQIREELENGNCVNWGWGGARLTAKGSAESVGEPWNPEKHRLVAVVAAKGDLKNCLADFDMVNTTVGATVVVQHVADTVNQTDGVIGGVSDVEVRVTGNGLAVDAEAEGEGVWIEDAKGVVQAVATVTEATTTTLGCRFATLPADGTYWLVVASRNGLGEAYGVGTGRKKITVCAVPASQGEVTP